ncbi:glycosyltransferase [Pseudanabaena sp. FACHB-1998]|uniref:glycosyltransferase n=1 Tax=Pseudanabaena sp. FACHB-1998 TaxID=2692858 RepID=UPI0016808B1B|nr:glycosyltransferase [Pseudanabaena sp. FACHB-1998]MBD2175907.1 glycosyltransferase [Pseudanabaena sp. FACHB-1998]
MKVLHVIPSIAAVRGGPSQAIIEMVRALRSQGIDAEIATTNDNGKELLDVPLYQLTDQLEEYAKVPIRFFPRFSPDINAVREFAFSGALTSWLWQHIKDYDLVHVHAIFSYASTIAMAIARLKGVPYINRPLGQLCEWSLQQSKQRKQIYLNIIERSNLLQSKCLHFTAEQERIEFTQLGLNIDNFVLPHGVHIPDLIPNAQEKLHQILQIPSHIPVILFMSRLHPKKGLEYLIPALGKLKEHSFALAIAGSGDRDYVHQIKVLLETHGISDRTHLLGFVKGETKYLYLQGADLFALTSHSENFGIAAIEALAAGTPVLITDGVAIAPMVKEQAIGYVTQLDIQAIATTLQIFFQNFEQSSTQQRINRQKIRKIISENYSWESISAQLATIYQDTIRV